MRNHRKRIWIDQFQTYLSLRLGLYFLLYQIAIWALFVIDARMHALEGIVGTVSSTYGFVLTPVALVALALLFIYDAAKLTHRIVGPLYRVRKTIQAVTAGEDVGLISLRQGDYLQDLKDDLNAMLKALEQRGAITLTATSPAMQPVVVGAPHSA